MFRKYPNGQKCPSFTESMFINESIRPNFMLGLKMTIHKNISRYIGARPLSTFISNTMNLSSIYPTGNRFGFLYNVTKSQTQKRNVTASVDANMEGYMTGELVLDVDKNATFSAWGQREPDKKNAIGASMEWSNVGLHARTMLTLNGNARKSRATMSVDNVCRLGDRLSIGSYLVFNRLFGGHAAKSGSVMRPSDYGGGIKYNGEREKFSATVSRDSDVSVHYRRLVSDELTTGASMTANVRKRTCKMTWMYRAVFGSGLELRGQCDTNGLVIGNIRKELSPNVTMGICTLLNHKTSKVGLGVELTMGMAPKRE